MCSDHAEKIADMAVEMLEAVQALVAPDGTQVRVRIGIHTGPVIAGVVGIKMIHYQVSTCYSCKFHIFLTLSIYGVIRY